MKKQSIAVYILVFSRFCFRDLEWAGLLKAIEAEERFEKMRNQIIKQQIMIEKERGDKKISFRNAKSY